MKSRNPQIIHKRKSMDTTADPYLSGVGLNGAAVCMKCRSVYQNKRWSIDEELYERKMANKYINNVTCPACKKVKDNYPGGILNLKGDFYYEHEGEIMNLIKNEEQRARVSNPLERIMKIVKTKQGIEITTTNEKLAQRIGKSLNRAYQGNIAYHWSDSNKLLRAVWMR